jgi:hypothetical protein
MTIFPKTNIHRSGGGGSFVWWLGSGVTSPQVLDIVGTTAMLLTAPNDVIDRRLL